MGSLRVLSGKEICRLLAEHGFVEVRRKGSHIVMQKRLLDTTTTGPETLAKLKAESRTAH